MHTWHWQTWEGLPYLTCSILKSWDHGFFTQHFWSHSPLELTKILQPNAEVCRVKQVHGNTVLTPGETKVQGAEGREQGAGSREQEFPSDTSDAAAAQSLAEADGLITEQAEQAVWVASADCTPVLIADLKTGQVAAVHAGWRGTAAKIVPQAIARLQTQGSKISDLRFALGPAIAGEVYQVSTQVAAMVGSTVFASSQDELILNNLQRLPNSPILTDPHPGRVRLDVRRVIALQLEQLGVSPEQVAIAPHCTYQEPEHFFSYRRDKLKKVQWSGIVSTQFS